MKSKTYQEFLRAEHEARYQAADTDGKLTIVLREISHAMRYSLYEGRGSRARILIQLQDMQSVTQRDLTDMLDIQPGSASEVLAKLENAGLIVRTPSISDRRTAIISLTEAGQTRASELRAQRRQTRFNMFSNLTEEEKSILITLLRKVNTHPEECAEAGEPEKEEKS